MAIRSDIQGSYNMLHETQLNQLLLQTFMGSSSIIAYAPLNIVNAVRMKDRGLQDSPPKENHSSQVSHFE